MNRKIRKAANMAALMLGVGALSIVVVPNAAASCASRPGDLGALNASLMAAAHGALSTSKSHAAASSEADHPGGADIVGMWAVTLTAKGNPNGPPDGVQIDAGFSQWHSDGTEIMNSSKPPATGNFCLGVWKKTGPSTYRLTHKMLDYAPNGILNGPGTLHEEVAVDRSGNGFAGVFSLDVYDTSGNLKVHVNGEVTGVRITVDRVESALRNASGRVIPEADFNADPLGEALQPV